MSVASPQPGPVEAWADEDLATLGAKNRLRSLEVLEVRQGAQVTIHGRAFIDCSSNDYLGLATSPELKRVAAAAVDKWGTGAGASRLVVGNFSAHQSFEASVARFDKKGDAVAFSSGYAANVGTIAALLRKRDAVFTDALNHASIIDGCRLSGAAVHVYRHSDTQHLDELLTTHRGARRLVVTDAVFSMDGDAAPLAAIFQTCRNHGAALLVDEAHATGVLGPRGAGLCEATGIEADIIVGTLSKALGVAGGYVAAAPKICHLLRNRARSFVFSTGIPPATAVVAEAAIRIVEKDIGGRRARLRDNIARFASALQTSGFAADATSAIFPIVMGGEARALTAADALREKGFLVKAIRPPTVPVGTSRLRIAISAMHADAQLDALASALRETCR